MVGTLAMATTLKKVALELSYILTNVASPYQKNIKTEIGGA